MKLIDVLVRHKDEIAERGEATNYFVMDPDGRVFGYQEMPEPNIVGWSVPGIKNSTDGYGCLIQVNPIDIKESWQECVVTLKQYESALSASKTEWDGVGLPPVGFECEMQDAVGEFIPVDIIANHDGFAFGWNYDRHAVYFSDKRCEFRPLSSEADKKRNEAVKAMVYHKNDPVDVTENGYHAIYDAIAAGKIPGIRID